MLTACGAGSIPRIFFAVKIGALQKYFHLSEIITWPWVKWPLLASCLLLPACINQSGILHKFASQREIGWGPHDNAQNRNKPTGAA